MKIRILSREDVRQSLPMKSVIEGMKRAFSQLSSGKTEMPLRSRVHIPEQEGVLLTMPAALPDDGELAVKLVSVFGKNPAKGLPLIHALVVVLDTQTGMPLALLDGEFLTGVRTGAGAGAATDLMAKPDAKSVAIIGSGNQARPMLEAVCTIRQIEQVKVYSPNADHCKIFAEEMSGYGPIPKVQSVTSAQAAVQEADIVCTATTSKTPVISFSDLKPGVHVNAVGSFQPSMQEVDAETIQNSLVIVDSRQSALVETGDLVIPIQQGLINSDHIKAELGELINGTFQWNKKPEQATYFKSCGVAVQDAVSANIALKNAEIQNLGTLVSL